MTARMPARPTAPLRSSRSSSSISSRSVAPPSSSAGPLPSSSVRSSSVSGRPAPAASPSSSPSPSPSSRASLKELPARPPPDVRQPLADSQAQGQDPERETEPSEKREQDQEQAHDPAQSPDRQHVEHSPPPNDTSRAAAPNPATPRASQTSASLAADINILPRPHGTALGVHLPSRPPLASRQHNTSNIVSGDDRFSGFRSSEQPRSISASSKARHFMPAQDPRNALAPGHARSPSMPIHPTWAGPGLPQAHPQPVSTTASQPYPQAQFLPSSNLKNNAANLQQGPFFPAPLYPPGSAGWTNASAHDAARNILTAFKTTIAEADSYIHFYQNRISLDAAAIKAQRQHLDRQAADDAKVDKMAFGWQKPAKVLPTAIRTPGTGTGTAGDIGGAAGIGIMGVGAGNGANLARTATVRSASEQIGAPPETTLSAKGGTDGVVREESNRANEATAPISSPSTPTSSIQSSLGQPNVNQFHGGPVRSGTATPPDPVVSTSPGPMNRSASGSRSHFGEAGEPTGGHKIAHTPTSPLPPAPTVRESWTELRRHDLASLHERSAALEDMRSSVVAPWQSFRDEQERIRRRIKSDLNTVMNRYEDGVNNQLRKARTGYENKCREVEQIRAQLAFLEEGGGVPAGSSFLHIQRKKPLPHLPGFGVGADSGAGSGPAYHLAVGQSPGQGIGPSVLEASPGHPLTHHSGSGHHGGAAPYKSALGRLGTLRHKFAPSASNPSAQPGTTGGPTRSRTASLPSGSQDPNVRAAHETAGLSASDDSLTDSAPGSHSGSGSSNKTGHQLHMALMTLPDTDTGYTSLLAEQSAQTGVQPLPPQPLSEDQIPAQAQGKDPLSRNANTGAISSGILGFSRAMSVASAGMAGIGAGLSAGLGSGLRGKRDKDIKEKPTEPVSQPGRYPALHASSAPFQNASGLADPSHSTGRHERDALPEMPHPGSVSPHGTPQQSKAEREGEGEDVTPRASTAAAAAALGAHPSSSFSSVASSVRSFDTAPGHDSTSNPGFLTRSSTLPAGARTGDRAPFREEDSIMGQQMADSGGQRYMRSLQDVPRDPLLGVSDIGYTPTGGIMGGTASESHSRYTLLNAKLDKAEAEDEALDATYRAKVFEVETLRVNQVKKLQAALSSVLASRRELGCLVRSTAEAMAGRQVRLHERLAAIHRAAWEDASHATDSLTAEIQRVSFALPSKRQIDANPEITYENYWYGECKHLLFGFTLTDYVFTQKNTTHGQAGPPATSFTAMGPSASSSTISGSTASSGPSPSRSQSPGPGSGLNRSASQTAEVASTRPPLIVSKTVDWIESGCGNQVPPPKLWQLYAIGGVPHETVQDLARVIEKDEIAFQWSRQNENEDPRAAAAILQFYLAQLPVAPLPMPWDERTRHTINMSQNQEEGWFRLARRIRQKPQINQVTLKCIVRHLARLAVVADVGPSQATAALARVFAPLCLADNPQEESSRRVASALNDDLTMADLIANHERILPPDQEAIEPEYGTGADAVSATANEPVSKLPLEENHGEQVVEPQTSAKEVSDENQSTPTPSKSELHMSSSTFPDTDVGSRSEHEAGPASHANAPSESMLSMYDTADESRHSSPAESKRVDLESLHSLSRQGSTHEHDGPNSSVQDRTEQTASHGPVKTTRSLNADVVGNGDRTSQKAGAWQHHRPSHVSLRTEESRVPPWGGAAWPPHLSDVPSWSQIEPRMAHGAGSPLTLLQQQALGPASDSSSILLFASPLSHPPEARTYAYNPQFDTDEDDDSAYRGMMFPESSTRSSFLSHNRRESHFQRPSHSRTRADPRSSLSHSQVPLVPQRNEDQVEPTDPARAKPASPPSTSPGTSPSPSLRAKASPGSHVASTTEVQKPANALQHSATASLSEWNTQPSSRAASQRRPEGGPTEQHGLPSPAPALAPALVSAAAPTSVDPGASVEEGPAEKLEPQNVDRYGNVNRGTSPASSAFSRTESMDKTSVTDPYADADDDRTWSKLDQPSFGPTSPSPVLGQPPPRTNKFQVPTTTSIPPSMDSTPSQAYRRERREEDAYTHAHANESHSPASIASPVLGSPSEKQAQYNAPTPAAPTYSPSGSSRTGTPKSVPRGGAPLDPSRQANIRASLLSTDGDRRRSSVASSHRQFPSSMRRSAASVRHSSASSVGAPP